MIVIHYIKLDLKLIWVVCKIGTNWKQNKLLGIDIFQHKMLSFENVPEETLEAHVFFWIVEIPFRRNIRNLIQNMNKDRVVVEIGYVFQVVHSNSDGKIRSSHHYPHCLLNQNFEMFRWGPFGHVSVLYFWPLKVWKKTIFYSRHEY